MESFGYYLLDVIGEFGGGRGSPQNDYVRFGLGIILYGGLLAWAMQRKKSGQSDRETLLVVGFSFGLARELFKFAVKSLEIQEVYQVADLENFFPPIDHALLGCARVIIGAAFLDYLLQSKTITRRYMWLGLISVVVFYVIVAPLWWQAVEVDPAIKFSKHWGDWFSHGAGLAMSITAIWYFLLAKGWARTAIITAFVMIALDDFLMLINLSVDDVLKDYFSPVRQTLHLLSIAVLGYIYFRERGEEHDRVLAQLQQDERIRSVGQLAAGVAHDFNNQLQAILGFAEIARLDAKGDTFALEQISDAGQRAAKLVNQLLTFSRTNVSTLTSCGVDKTIKGLRPILTQLLGVENRLELNLGAGAQHIGISPTQLEQVMTNLVVNARDAMETGGKVTISTTLLPDDSGGFKRLQIIVRDTGRGMDEHTKAHAFDPFFTTKQFGSGAGLGLATVFGITDRAKGKVKIETALGQGAAFVLDYPTRKAVPEKRNVPSGKLLAGPLHVIVADDEAAVRHYAATVLERAGYRVTLATDGNEVVKLVLSSEIAIDLVLFDFAMPGLNGFRAFEEIHGQRPDIPVLFMSGNDKQPQLVATGLPFVGKPFDGATLLNSIAAVLAGKAVG